jgi:hypothetical protein
VVVNELYDAAGRLAARSDFSLHLQMDRWRSLHIQLLISGGGHFTSSCDHNDSAHGVYIISKLECSGLISTHFACSDFATCKLRLHALLTY